MPDFLLIERKKMKFILGKKVGMSQFFDEKGNVVPFTLIEAGPCKITQIKTKERDGYDSAQIGFEELVKAKRIKKTQSGKPYRFLREFKGGEYKEGEVITVSLFKEGDEVKISGTSKGKGFQGAVKLWGFHGRRATHGVKHEHRTLGSVGATGPQRVFRGKKMPGRMGAERITVKNLKVVKVDAENNMLAVKGGIPGPNGSLVEIRG